MSDVESRAGHSYRKRRSRDFVDSVHHVESPAMRDALIALQRAGMPSIQLAPGDGAALAVLLRAAGARRVVEIGTLSGYSALWILRALPADGKLWTLEADPGHAAVAQGVLARAGALGRVEVVVGPGLESLPRIEHHGPFDAVFIDADKRSYPAYAEWSLANLRSGGLIIADNAFLFGHLVGHEPSERASAEEIEAMQRFHRLISERCELSACLPTPDGLAVAIVP